LTAGQLAEEFGVSVRTIYRDIDALCIVGIPIYGDRGPDGGYSLLESYRTNLTGLHEDEVRALFMLDIPPQLVELGVGQALKSALLKLSASLPETHRSSEKGVRGRFHLDTVWWFQGGESTSHLHTIYKAVWDNRKLMISYHPEPGIPIELNQQIDPYGLVAKAGVWYVVYPRKGRINAIRLSRLLDVRILDATFERPGDFDLAASWEVWSAEYEFNRPLLLVKARIATHFLSQLPRYFGETVIIEGEEGSSHVDGWMTLTLPFETFEDARNRLLGFGGAVEVLEPEALRLSIADYAAKITALYKKD
jgi:predicted DNA-binding transcriptional regulator YafY